jgi:hypothetical protein
LVLATGEELRLEPLIEQLSLLEGLDFRLQSFGLGAAYGALIIPRVTGIALFEISFNTLVNLREELREPILGKVALFRIDCPELATIDGDQFGTEEVELLAQQREGAADLSKGLKVVLAEVGDRLVIGPELFQQPQPLDIAVRLPLKATT